MRSRARTQARPIRTRDRPLPRARRARSRPSRHERAERDVGEPLGEEERRKYGEEDRSRVEGQHCERDRAALDGLEEEPPMRRLHHAERDERPEMRAGMRARARGVLESATAPSVSAARTSRRKASGPASRLTAPARTATRPQAAASAASPAFQRISAHMRSGASTPIRSRQRATTFFVAVQSPRRKRSSGDPSTLWWW